MAKSKYSIKSFADAQSAFECSKTGKITHNTWIVRENDGASYAVVFHRTKIVRYHFDGRIQLNSGGYQTVTTKQRMNRFSPLKIGQTNFEWFVYLPDNYASTGKMYKWNTPVTFFDGIEVSIG
jgi:hypothetical protein